MVLLHSHMFLQPMKMFHGCGSTAATTTWCKNGLFCIELHTCTQVILLDELTLDARLFSKKFFIWGPLL